MNELRPYLKLFNKNTKTYVITLFIVAIFINALQVIAIHFTDAKTFSGNPLPFISSISTYITILIFVYGITLIHKDFSGAISIRADRNSCIKAVVINLVTLGVIFSIMSVALIFLSEIIAEYSIGYNIDIISLINQELKWTSIPMVLKYTSSNVLLAYLNFFVSLCLDVICLGLIGALIGAFVYRVRKITSFALFIGFPSLVIIYVINYATKESHKLYKYLDKIINLLENPSIWVGIKLCTILVSLLLVVLLLKKAPIKDYANDLL